jgi:hypothetical protein
MREKFVPKVERILFIFPALFFAEIIDWRAKPGFFRRQRGEIRNARAGIVCNKAARSVSREECFAALRRSQQKTVQIFFLLERESIPHLLQDNVA